MNVENIRNFIPKDTVRLFDDIVSGKVLGASNHIKMIGEMLKSISNNEKDNQICFNNIEKLAKYFKDTRGKSSYAIVSALNLMTKSLKYGKDNIQNNIKEDIQNYFHQSEAASKKVVEYSVRLAKDMKTIMIFDYSSTVEKFISNLSNKIKIYIPESRVIDGGKPFVSAAVNCGHYVHFIADAAMLSVLHNIDAVFIGAETFYPSGSTFNTIGSDMLAEICKLHYVPYYVLTPLIKVDMRVINGIFKEPITTNLKNRLCNNLDENIKEKIDFSSLELVEIKSEYITAFVTEEGIFSPQSMYAISKEFDEKVNGGRI